MRSPRILASAALALALVLGAAPLALAQPRNRPAPERTGAPITEYGEGAFEPSQVEGNRHTSTGDRVVGRVAEQLGSLIRIRTNFYPELTKSVESQ